MSLSLQALLAISPILLAAALLIGFRVPAKWAMPAVYLAAASIALTAWDLTWTRVIASSIQGLFITAGILLIVFAAILLLNTLQQSGAVASIRRSFHHLNDDRRVQVVIVAWLFGSFIEGAAGFGTPAAIAAPLMVALRFPPACAVMLGMMIQSTAVTFGAVGTPVVLGVAGGLGDENMIAVAGSKDAYLQMVTVRAALLHGITGTLMPTLMVMMMTRFFGERRSWTDGLSIFPFALFGGLAFTVPYFLTAWSLGPEFPSLLGGMVGLAIVTFATRRKFLVPKDTWDFPEQSTWADDWLGRAGVEPTPNDDTDPRLRTWLAWAPYVLVAALLVVTRAIPDVKAALTSYYVTLQWPNILGEGIDGKITPLYLPAFVLLLVVAATYFLHRMSPTGMQRAFGASCRVILGAGFVLVFTVPMVRVYINSGLAEGKKFVVLGVTQPADFDAIRTRLDQVGGQLVPFIQAPSEDQKADVIVAGARADESDIRRMTKPEAVVLSPAAFEQIYRYASMPIAMARWVAANVGAVWPMFAGMIGALGAFIAGSNTVSNLMFCKFQYGVAEHLGVSSAMIVALQAVGAAAGNMIAIHNVVAASATVGLLGREGATLRKTILPTLYYLTVIGGLGLIAVYVIKVS